MKLNNLEKSAFAAIIGLALVTYCHADEVKTLDSATGKMLASLQGHTGDVYSIAWSPNGKTLASGSGDRTVKLWDVAKGKQLSNLRGHTGTLASGSDDRTVKFWDAAAGKERLQ